MKRPEMILFDYGTTLCYEPNWNNHGSCSAIFPYISENPHNISLEEFDRFLLSFFDEIRNLRGELIEIHEEFFLRYVLDYFNIKLSVSMDEAQWIMWNGMSQGQPTPGVSEMLSLLRDKSIRTGVISNLCWSAKTLTRRLSSFFPEHHFDFIITSSEYIFRKPEKRIFELALAKAGLSPDKVWYCGNDVAADVIGAQGAGIFPVLYDEPKINSAFSVKNSEYNIQFPYLHIHQWTELIDTINNI